MTSVTPAPVQPQPIRHSVTSNYVQYGCGWSAPDDWINFDASFTLRWERLPILGRIYTKNARRFPANVKYGDIVKGLPIAEESCRGIYASHVLEHLALEDFHRALKNTYKLLRKGGVFRLVVPDLEGLVREYLGRLERNEVNANTLLLRQTNLGTERRPRGIIGNVYKLLNTSSHLWMWDQTSLTYALEEAGFVQVRPCRFGDSEDDKFTLVEEAVRFEKHAVAMEGRR